MAYNLDDYKDVAERIKEFYDRFPEGRLTSEPPYLLEINGKPFICCHAKAYRTPDDPHPGDGLAWEPVPGPTQFTRDSELMNAQTAAWGRAIVALGFETKKIASKQEVKARQPEKKEQKREFKPAALDEKPEFADDGLNAGARVAEFAQLKAQLLSLGDQLDRRKEFETALAQHDGQLVWVRNQILRAEAAVGKKKAAA